MTTTAEHPATAKLRQLSTLREMPAPELQQLSEQLYVGEAEKGTMLLDFGATDDSTLYLLEGSCQLTAEDGKKKVIEHTDTSALAPLARLRPSHYRVVALGPVRYLVIENSLIQHTQSTFERSSSLTLETYQVEEEIDEIVEDENRLTLRIYEDLNSGHLLLPSLPTVAVHIGEAVSDDNADAKQVAGLIETDPAIAIKIVKAANSARFGGVAQVATVTEAVARLGMRNTQTLVITFALRELFRTKSKPLVKRMLDLWEHSRRIAATTQVLADKVGGFNSHEALLAGLVHDIGGLAVVAYARDFPDIVDHPGSLESSIRALRSQLSGMILSKWQLPAELVTAAKEAENWYREHEGDPDYGDLVIVAQIHDGIGGDLDPDKVPALGRLGLSPSEVDQGLSLLNQADDEIAAAKELLTD